MNIFRIFSRGPSQQQSLGGGSARVWAAAIGAAGAIIAALISVFPELLAYFG